MSLPGSKFISLPRDSMHGTIWFHTIISCRFHPWNRMESYGSMHGIAWNHMVLCIESYGIIWFQAWNRMELYNCRHEIGLNHMENEGNHSNDI